jgi:hypothetical protein
VYKETENNNTTKLNLKGEIFLLNKLLEFRILIKDIYCYV